ncbi:MAG: phosphoglucosamine mutase, partial [Acidobacteriota bacterium]
QLFGTDGVRGEFGTAPMDERTLRRLAAALAEHLLAAHPAGGRVVLGGDTRFSTPQICRWLAAELIARGLEVTYLGVMTTPGVASTTAADPRAVCGVAVSASHNPAADNGVKLVGPDGFKWPTREEAALEQRMLGAARSLESAGGEAVLEVDRDAVEAYLESLRRGQNGGSLDGLSAVIDCGHGAASPYAERLFESLGARVVMMGNAPDGRNINLGCGSTQPQGLAQQVREHGADLGVAFDGDADRVILVDSEGEIRDGDTILYLWASFLKRSGRLAAPQVVATSMSNLGLEVALEEAGIELVRCDVGDRAVVRTLRDRGLILGGEQSGHIVNLDLATTGDGLLTALQLAGILQAERAPLPELLRGFRRFPQVLRGLKVRHKPPLDSLTRVAEQAEHTRRTLGSRGRLVLRYSGTEPLVRTMIEGPDLEQIERLADRLESVLADELA